jgi:hypothetical protein
MNNVVVDFDFKLEGEDSISFLEKETAAQSVEK